MIYCRFVSRNQFLWYGLCKSQSDLSSIQRRTTRNANREMQVDSEAANKPRINTSCVYIKYEAVGFTW